jgi:hypothetical protein
MWNRTVTHGNKRREAFFSVLKIHDLHKEKLQALKVLLWLETLETFHFLLPKSLASWQIRPTVLCYLLTVYTISCSCKKDNVTVAHYLRIHIVHSYLYFFFLLEWAVMFCVCSSHADTLPKRQTQWFSSSYRQKRYHGQCGS